MLAQTKTSEQQPLTSPSRLPNHSRLHFWNFPIFQVLTHWQQKGDENYLSRTRTFFALDSIRHDTLRYLR